jgi:hypothetical protein
VRTEIPSGIDSKRYPLRSVSPTVISGETVTPGITGVSIDGCAVRKPLFLSPAPAGAAPEAVIATATAPQAAIERLLIFPSPRGRGVSGLHAPAARV